MRQLFLILGLLLCGCSNDITDLGGAPELSPVGAGMIETASIDRLQANPAFANSQDSWRGGNGDFFRDDRARKVGDIITVLIGIDDKATLNNTSNRLRKSAGSSDLDFSYELMGVTGTEIAGQGSFNSNSASTGQGSTNRSEKINLSVAAIVTAVLPNGNMVIDGSQEVLVNFETRILKIGGIVHPSDITPDNSITYEKIAEARIAYGGKGRLTEVQQPGWLHQIWDRLTPF